MPRARLYWICQFAGWTGVSVLILGVQLAMGAAYKGASDFIGWLVYIGAGIGLTHAARAWLRRKQWLQMHFGRLALHVCVLAALLGMALGASIIAGIALAAPVRLTLPTIVGSWFNGSVLSFAWLVIYCGAGLYHSAQLSRVEAMRMRLETKQAQLAALESQVNPHFLFNALNSLRALINEDPQRATAMVTQLADLLRYSLRSDRRETVTLAEELDIVRHYLAIEKTRFEERLQVEIDVDEAARNERLPPMLLQTLAENAIKHGIAHRTTGGLIRLEARVNGGGLRVDVLNTGALAGSTGGVGLRNARERLRLLFGERARLTLAPQGPDHVLARLELFTA